MQGLSVVRADSQSLEVASEILTEAARWLIERGQPLWKPEDLTPERLAPEARAGVLYLGHLADKAVATIKLQHEDQVFWPDAAPGDSAFVHRLAVRRRVAGTGVAEALLAWAMSRARSDGRRWLRLDCSADHPGLARYYEGQGFERHSKGSLGRWRFLRYQKRLSVD